MKNLKSKLAAMAMILGLGSALVTSAAPRNMANKTWGHRANGTYVDLTGKTEDDYDCTGSTNVCTAVYPSTQDPNSDPANPISTIPGQFSGL